MNCIKRHDDSFNDRLARYSAVAGAVLLAASPAAAQVTVLTAADFNGGVGGVPVFNTGTGVITTLHFHLATVHSRGFFGTFSGYHNAAGTKGVVGIGANQPMHLVNLGSIHFEAADNLAYGQHVDGRNFNGVSRPELTFLNPVPHGSFAPAGGATHATGYVGFKFGGGGSTYFGWMRVKLTDTANGAPVSVTFVDYNGDGIYGAFAKLSITAGQGRLTAIPEPATAAAGLALFALGAAGVREFRRRRQAA